MKDLPKVGALGEAEHGANDSFDESMVGMPHHLLDNIIQVLTLSDLDASIFINIVLSYPSGIGAAFVDTN